MALLIAIEGIDGSGKGTQAARLRDALLSQGASAALLSFPQYAQTRFGRAVGEFLNGRFGALDEVHPQLASLLFAGDRFESKPRLETALNENDVVVCDRYVASNMAHQAAKLDEPERTELLRWIEDLESTVYALPRADLTVLFDVPASTAQQLIARKAARDYTDKTADLQEADADYLDRVRQVYLRLAEQDDSWACVSVVRDGEVRPIDEIAEELLHVVNEYRTSP